jgi:CRP-like cAMP-binding protein
MQNNAVFQGFTDEEIQSFIAFLGAIEKNYNKGDYLIRNAQYLSYFILIMEGKGKLEVTDSKGRVVSLMEFAAGDLLAAELLFSNKAFPVDAIADSEVKTLIINKDKWMELISSKAILLKNFLQINAAKTAQLYEKIKCFSFRSLRERYIVYILSLADEQESDNIILHKSQNELAQFFGVNRPSLGREVRDMHNQGLIKQEGKRLFIPDRKKLESYVNIGSSKCINCMGCK